MKDVAEALGVSVVTVSRALRDRPDISKATRQAVLDKMNEMRYRPNILARSLATGKSNLIGLVVPDLMQTFFAEIAHGVTRALTPLGYQVVIANSEDDADLERREIRALVARQVDGLIIAFADALGAPPMVAELREQSIPFVLIDRNVPNCKANFVGVSDEKVGCLATQHLINCGKRRIAHIRGPSISTANGRFAGYVKTLAKAGLSATAPSWETSAVDDRSGYQAMNKLLKSALIPDGVFCYNDPVAVGAIDAILDAGYRIPSDVAVIGAANMYYSRMFKIPLSSIDQSSIRIGREAAALIMRLLSEEVEGEQTVLISPRLIARESTGVVATAARARTGSGKPRGGRYAPA